MMSMRFKLLGILVLILGYTSSSVAQEGRSLGESIYLYKFYRHNKLSSHSGIEKRRVFSETNPSSGLLYERGTATLQGGGTYTPTYTTTDYLTGKRLGLGTPTVPILRSLLGQSLYKKTLYNKNKKERKEKSRDYSFSKMEKKDEYYSDIFYKGRKSQPEVKEKEVTPFLKK